MVSAGIGKAARAFAQPAYMPFWVAGGGGGLTDTTNWNIVF